jgi:hypothetical protein
LTFEDVVLNEFFDKDTALRYKQIAEGRAHVALASCTLKDFASGYEKTIMPLLLDATQLKMENVTLDLSSCKKDLTRLESVSLYKCDLKLPPQSQVLFANVKHLELRAQSMLNVSKRFPNLEHFTFDGAT